LFHSLSLESSRPLIMEYVFMAFEMR